MHENLHWPVTRLARPRARWVSQPRPREQARTRIAQASAVGNGRATYPTVAQRSSVFMRTSRRGYPSREKNVFLPVSTKFDPLCCLGHSVHTAFRMVCDLCRSSKLFTELKRTTQTTISWRHFFASFQTELACLSSCLDEGKSFPVIFVLKIVSSVKWLDTSVDRIMRTMACRQTMHSTAQFAALPRARKFLDTANTLFFSNNNINWSQF